MTRLASGLFEIGQFFMSIRNYDSTQTNYRKKRSSPLVRKSNLKIINIFGREILNSGSGRKKLSKTHRPKTGVAAPWELTSLGKSQVTTVEARGTNVPPSISKYFSEIFSPSHIKLTNKTRIWTLNRSSDRRNSRILN